MGVTIKDVARQAGVAPSTVSRVIHDNPRISEITRDLVKKTMDEMGYHPHAAARNLARGKTYTLGLIIPNSEDDLFVHPFFIRAMRGLSVEAQKRGYNIMFCFSSSEEEEVSFIQRYVRMNLVDGIILMVSRKEDKCMAYLESKNFPYVVIGRPESQFKNALWVDNDNFQAMYNMVIFFLNRGKTRIAYMGGSSDFYVSQDRLRGYKEALRTHGIPIDEELIMMVQKFREKNGYDMARKLLEKETPDAIAASDDTFAIGALDYMKETGEYIAIAGFNNTLEGEIISPSLTSVDVKTEILGIQAATILIDDLERKIEDKEHIRYSIVDTILVERDSTDSDFLRKSHEKFL